MIATADPAVFLEEQRDGYARYVDRDGKRWEVIGSCDRRGDCLVGSVVDGEQILSRHHLSEICARLGLERIDSPLDVPVRPGFSGCCPLRTVELS